MRVLRVAFWNLFNLFPVGAAPRAPRTRPELQAKLARLATCVDGFFAGAGPDVLGLAEVATEDLARSLLRRLRGSYEFVWAEPTQSDSTGLALAYRPDCLGNVCRIDESRGPTRPWAVLVEARVRGTHAADKQAAFVIAHWKSRLREAERRADAELRCVAADWLAQHLHSYGRGRCVIVLGDFNAQPFEPPFGPTHLDATRLFSSAIRTTRPYNAAWKLFPEPNTIAQYNEDDYMLPRPVTSWDRRRVIYDQLLVSGGALRGGPLELKEDTVRYHYVDRLNARRTRMVIEPLRFTYDSLSQSAAGASDHFPVLAEFCVN